MNKRAANDRSFRDHSPELVDALLRADAERRIALHRLQPTRRHAPAPAPQLSPAATLALIAIVLVALAAYLIGKV